MNKIIISPVLKSIHVYASTSLKFLNTYILGFTCFLIISTYLCSSCVVLTYGYLLQNLFFYFVIQIVAYLLECLQRFSYLLCENYPFQIYCFSHKTYRALLISSSINCSIYFSWISLNALARYFLLFLKNHFAKKCLPERLSNSESNIKIVCHRKTSPDNIYASFRVFKSSLVAILSFFLIILRKVFDKK